MLEDRGYVGAFNQTFYTCQDGRCWICPFIKKQHKKKDRNLCAFKLKPMYVVSSDLSLFEPANNMVINIQIDVKGYIFILICKLIEKKIWTKIIPTCRVEIIPFPILCYVIWCLIVWNHTNSSVFVYLINCNCTWISWIQNIFLH